MLYINYDHFATVNVETKNISFFRIHAVNHSSATCILNNSMIINMFCAFAINKPCADNASSLNLIIFSLVWHPIYTNKQHSVKIITKK